MQEVFEKIIEKLRTEKNVDRSKVYSPEQCDTIRYSFGAAIDAVKVVAAEYNNGWIPCSERLPEDEQVVLTCKYKSISILRFSKKTNHWYELSGNWWWNASMVDAWRPLPAPYQPNGE